MTNNHIGTAFEIIKDIATQLGWNYSHGQLTDMGLKAITVYPLCHATIQSVSVTDQTATIGMNVAIADVVNYLKTENEDQTLRTTYAEIGYTENQNYAHILQNLYVAFSQKLYAKEKEYFSQIQWIRPIAFTPFTEGGQDVLTGYNVSITIELQNPWVTDGTCY